MEIFSKISRKYPEISTEFLQILVLCWENGRFFRSTHFLQLFYISYCYIFFEVFSIILITSQIFFDYHCDTKKGQELFRRPFYSYIFWGAESEFEVKIARFGDNFKKSYFRLYGKIWYGYGFQATEFNNEAMVWS